MKTKYLWIVLLFSSVALAAPIHHFAAQGDIQKVKGLLDSWTCLVDEEDGQGRTPLIHAIINGQHDMVRFLLTRGADPLYQFRMGESKQNPWRLAQQSNNRDILLTLGMAMQGKLQQPVAPEMLAAYRQVRQQLAKAKTLDEQLKKSILETILPLIESLAPTAASNLEHQALFYQCVQLLWQLNEKQKFCLACFQDKKIAKSHYISACILRDIGEWFLNPEKSEFCKSDPNSLVASPLCCTGGNTECEQHFSGQEQKFSDEFLKKFSATLQQQIRDGADINVQLDYGSYLYYVAVLHAYRVMLNNFRVRDNWASMETIEDVATFPALLAFVDNMGRFLIDRTGSVRSRARVMLFVNSKDVLKNDLSYGHFKQAFPEHAGVIAHFGFHGLHFVVVDSAQTMALIQSDFKIAGMQRFDINPQGGRLEIKQPKSPNWPIPPYLQSLLEHFDDLLEEQAGRLDPDKIGQELKHKKIARPAAQQGELRDRKHLVLLPEYVQLNDEDPQIITKDYIEHCDQKERTHLFYKQSADSWFVIGTRNLDPKHKATLGFKFNEPAARSYIEDRYRRGLTVDFDELASVLKAEPWGRTSHQPVTYYPEFPAEIIGPVFSDYVFRTSALQEDPHWYNDNDVDSALRLRLEEENLTEDRAVFSVVPIGGTSEGNQLRTFLDEEMSRHGELSSDRTVLLPYNIGNQHWVGLVIRVQNRNVSVEYYDSLTEQPQIPSWVVAELRAVYGNEVRVRAAANLLQIDSHSCGPLMVENLVQRALGIQLQAPRFISHDGSEVRNHHHSLRTNGNWVDPIPVIRQMGYHVLQAAWVFTALFSKHLILPSKHKKGK